MQKRERIAAAAHSAQFKKPRSSAGHKERVTTGSSQSLERRCGLARHRAHTEPGLSRALSLLLQPPTRSWGPYLARVYNLTECWVSGSPSTLMLTHTRCPRHIARSPPRVDRSLDNRSRAQLESRAAAKEVATVRDATGVIRQKSSLNKFKTNIKVTLCGESDRDCDKSRTRRFVLTRDKDGRITSVHEETFSWKSVEGLFYDNEFQRLGFGVIGEESTACSRQLNLCSRQRSIK